MKQSNLKKNARNSIRLILSGEELVSCGEQKKEKPGWEDQPGITGGSSFFSFVVV